jgi:hypothetical protein
MGLDACLRSQITDLQTGLKRSGPVQQEVTRQRTALIAALERAGWTRPAGQIEALSRPPCQKDFVTHFILGAIFMFTSQGAIPTPISFRLPC